METDQDQLQIINDTLKVQQEYIINMRTAMNSRFESLERYIKQANNINHLQTLLLTVIRYNALLSNLIDLILYNDGARMYYLAEYKNFSIIIDGLNNTLEGDRTLYLLKKQIRNF